MRFIAALLAVAPGAVLADTIKITATSDLKFDPDEATAKQGDVLEFHFQPKNHSVAMGEFGSINGACVPANEGGFFSGYMPTSDGENVRSPCCKRNGPLQSCRAQNEAKGPR